MEIAAGYHLIEIPEKGIAIDMPKDLSQCDERQYREMSDLIYKYQTGVIGYENFRYLAVYRLLNLKHSKKDKHSGDYEPNLYMISELIDSFFDRKIIQEKEELHLIQNYVHNPIKTSSSGFKKLYGPEDYFSDITFGQYVAGLNYLGAYVKNQSKEVLYKLFATFYQDKKDKKAGRYNKKDFIKRSDIASKAYLGDVYGFFLLFTSFQHYITTAAISWEGKEIPLSILFESTKNDYKSTIPGLGMLSMSFMLSETTVFGSLEDVEQANFWRVILRMYDIKKRDLDEIARAEKLKKKSR